MSDSDDVFGEDPGFEQFADEFDRRRKALFERLEEYMDEEDLDDDYMGQLLLDALVRLRMAAYGTGVERPSVAGLKLDLDRLQKQVVEVLREAKKDAEQYIATVKEARAAAEAEEDEENGESEETEQDSK
jgi:hypothetical protein